MNMFGVYIYDFIDKNVRRLVRKKLVWFVVNYILCHSWLLAALPLINEQNLISIQVALVADSVHSI